MRCPACDGDGFDMGVDGPVPCRTCRGAEALLSDAELRDAEVHGRSVRLRRLAAELIYRRREVASLRTRVAVLEIERNRCG